MATSDLKPVDHWDARESYARLAHRLDLLETSVLNLAHSQQMTNKAVEMIIVELRQGQQNG
jgi:hypothetical protein